ncbi:MAG: nucleotidyltransferase family protein [Bacteroidota bacterium]
MKAMILAAGLGTRLMSLTQNTPKALVKCNGITLLEHALNNIKRAGIQEVVINVHHFAPQIISFLEQHQHFGLHIHISDESAQLLDSGGGVLNAQKYFSADEAFLVWNVDVVSNISISNMMETFNKTENFALLAVRHRNTSRYLLFDDNNRLCGWENTKTNERKIMQAALHFIPLAYSGIQILHPDVFKYNQLKGVFSLTQMYLELCKNHLIKAYPHDEDYWFDLGTPEAIKRAETFLNSNPN